jgi:hypothetical protein
MTSKPAIPMYYYLICERFIILKGPSWSNYVFVELLIRLIGGGLAPSSQSRILIENSWLVKLAGKMITT